MKLSQGAGLPTFLITLRNWDGVTLDLGHVLAVTGAVLRTLLLIDSLALPLLLVHLLAHVLTGAFLDFNGGAGSKIRPNIKNYYENFIDHNQPGLRLDTIGGLDICVDLAVDNLIGLDAGLSLLGLAAAAGLLRTEGNLDVLVDAVLLLHLDPDLLLAHLLVCGVALLLLHFVTQGGRGRRGVLGHHVGRRV